MNVSIGFSTTHVVLSVGDFAVLRSPFTMEGGFSHGSVPGVAGDVETLVGSGVVTTTWRARTAPDADTRVWDLTFAHYDFLGESQVPEPATLMLFGIGGAAAAFGRRKRRVS